MNIAILGCGRVGARVATQLGASHDITIIDWNSSSFERLGEDFEGRTVLGNGIDVDVLRAASVGQADVFIAVTDGDNRNLMAAQVAKHLGVPRVLVRVYDSERCGIFSQMGITTVSPTIGGARRLYEMLVDSREDH